MLSRFRGLLARLPAALVLLALAAVAAAGYFNDWKLPHLFNSGASSGGERPDVEAAAADEPGPAARTILLSAEAVRKSGIETAAVAERPMAQYVHAHGSFDYDQTHYARVGPRAAGVVWQICRQPGDVVRQGDVAAVVESAEAGRAKAAFAQSLLHVEAKERSLKAVQAQAKVVPDLFPELSLRDAESQLREARTRLFADQQVLFNLGLPIGVEEVAGQPEEQVLRRLRLLGLRDPGVRPLDPDTATINLLPVTAPFDGVVVARTAALGETAAPEHPIFVIADLHKVWAACEVRLEDVSLLSLGQEVVVRPDGAAEDAPTGRLTWISPEADDRTHTVQARAEIANDGTVRPNTPFEGNIVVRRNPRAIAVPAEAVQWEGGAALIFVRVSDEEYEPRSVRVGLRDGDFLEIASGAAPGEVVVTRGSHVLKAERLKDRIGGDD